jgi:hypothetical protein
MPIIPSLGRKRQKPAGDLVSKIIKMMGQLLGTEVEPSPKYIKWGSSGNRCETLIIHCFVCLCKDF